ncbi:hypothetical protein [Sphingomonas aracearum]|uniref:Uncharacterized protein n=1 Tax=Sphingomonas aracearum TaxID=2283317 RepID=A0A369VUM0_9SPHN|nr:hypothetical protein [Sphingomonas aracearum]RDE05783.1 hypothetical protein DVW87_11330 [Sphingomonas aracearum]
MLRGENNSTPAGRAYLRRFWPTMISYVVALFGATWALRHFHPTGAALVVLSVLPAVPVIAIIGVMGLYIVEERDEYLRQRVVSGMLVGIAVSLSVMTAWGFMEEAGVLPHLPGYFAFVLWCAGWGIGQCLLGLRERHAGHGA